MEAFAVPKKKKKEERSLLKKHRLYHNCICSLHFSSFVVFSLWNWSSCWKTGFIVLLLGYFLILSQCFRRLNEHHYKSNFLPPFPLLYFCAPGLTCVRLVWVSVLTNHRSCGAARSGFLKKMFVAFSCRFYVRLPQNCITNECVANSNFY